MELNALCLPPPVKWRFVTKTLLIMKLSVILLTVASLGVTAAGRTQTVSFSGREVPLEKVFSAIKQQTGYVVFFEYSLLHEARPVTIEAKNEPLTIFLNRLFINQPLSYTIEGKTILITERSTSPSPAQDNPLAPPTDIHGRVTDSLGNPLAGASVTVKGTKKGTQTDANGMFELKGVNQGAALVVSFTGYTTQVFGAQGRSGMSFVLNRSESPLDAVQVIAYGSTTERISIGNISTVNAADIAKQPVDNPLLALEGRVPGLFITAANGLPGAGVTVRVQGQNSLQSGNDPLYVVDGVPYVSQMLTTTTGGQVGILGNSGYSVSAPGGGGNPMNYINPSDIESIDVLKDADATAIYGSRAANGAVLITTKKARPGKPGSTSMHNKG
jgi:TonB-dependent starch-binding outer membrane protein SusC